MASKSLKRTKFDSDSDTETVTALTPSWPHFLVMTDAESESGRLKTLSPFAVSLGIRSIAGEPKSVKSIKSGLLIEVRKQAHAENLLKTTTFVEVPVKVTPHRSLNSCRGVIRCQELAGLDEGEIQSELASQCVSHVKRICLNKGQKKTNTYILTFSLTKIPAAIKIGYINAKVSLYIPNPLRCFRCQRFGHGQGSCIRTPRCVNCTGCDHVSDHCTEPSRCANCPDGASHKASDRNCPMYLKEKEILRIKYTENISFPEARTRVDNTQPQSTSASYSQILQGRPKISLTSRAVQTDITWPRGQDVPTEVSTTSASTQTVSDVSKPNTVSQQHKSATEKPLPKRKEDKKPKKKKSSKSTSPRRSQSASRRGRSPSPTRENHPSSTSGRGRIVRPHLPVTTSNKFDGLENMDITPESSTRSGSISPISHPGGSG